MADVWEGRRDRCNSSSDSYRERLHLEPIYEAFVCPLTKKVMEDPVTLENGQTFERAAVEKWFKELRGSGKKPICPLTLQELKSTDLNPSLPLRNTIEEWRKRNEASQLDFALRTLSPESSESDILLALEYIQNLCLKRKSQKHIMLSEGVISRVVIMLKSSSSDVTCKALKTLRIVAEDEDEIKEAVAVGDSIRTTVKFLTQDLFNEREEAISLLYELSKCESLSEKIGAVSGAILILDGLVSSNSEDILTVQKAEKILENLETCEKNVLQMAENGRMQPLVRLLLEGSPETQLAMVSFLGDLVLSNDVKVLVAQTAGSSLVNVMRSGSMQAREASLKALNQISSYEVSAKMLIETGILPPLVKGLFAVGSNQLPMRLKEVSATVLANVVSSDVDIESVLLDNDCQTLVSENIVHNLLHLISNTGPSIECKLLQVLVGLTSSPATVMNIASAIKSSGATISLIQFIEAPQRDLRMASIKLLHNISPYMSHELAEALCCTAGQLSGLISIFSEDNGVSEVQAAAVGLLAELPERDLGLTQHLLNEGAFDVTISKIRRVRQGTTRGGRFVTPYMEGLVRILSRITFVLEDEPITITFARENNLLALFSDLLQSNGLDNVQMVSAMALENLSQQSKRLTRIPEIPEAGFWCTIFPCFYKEPTVTGRCRVHLGVCSIVESFCLLEGKVVEKLLACLDHRNEKVVESALAALCTLLDDRVDKEQGVLILYEADGITPIVNVLLENRTQILRTRAVWAVERIMRTEDIANIISSNPRVGPALVDAFRHSDYQTRQIAEKALKLMDKLPNFSGVFPKMSK